MAYDERNPWVPQEDPHAGRGNEQALPYGQEPPWYDSERPWPAAENPADDGYGWSPDGFQEAEPQRTFQPGGLILPAHPLPEHRRGITDFDRYLERPAFKFQIFSAEQRRKKLRRGLAIGAGIALAVFIIAWAAVSSGQGA